MTVKKPEPLPSLAALERAVLARAKAHAETLAAAQAAIAEARASESALGLSQSALDERIAEMRLNAHVDSHWGRQFAALPSERVIERALNLVPGNRAA